MRALGGRRLVVEHARQAPGDLPRGVLEVRESPLGLHDLAGQRLLALPPNATLSPAAPRRFLLLAPGWNVQLLDAGVAAPAPDLWSQVQAAFGRRAVEFARVPAGQALWCRLEKALPSGGGVLLSLRDLNRHLQALPVNPAQVAAFYWDGRTLEVRLPSGQGFGLHRHDCSRCGAPIDAPGELRVLNGQDYCLECYSHVEREHKRAVRSRAQRAVGICRGCVYYALSFEGRSYGLSGRAGAVCTQPDRIARSGPLNGRVDSCRYRRERAPGEGRLRVGTVGRLTTEDRRYR